MLSLRFAASPWARFSLRLLSAVGLLLDRRRKHLVARCLADANGGLYIAAESEDDLKGALEKTLGCPMVTQGLSPPKNGG